MMYDRAFLIRGMFKDLIQKDAVNEDKRIDRFDKKFVRPFLEAIIKVCEEHQLCIDANLDGSLVLTDLEPNIISKYKDISVDILNKKIEKKLKNEVSAIQ